MNFNCSDSVATSEKFVSNSGCGVLDVGDGRLVYAYGTEAVCDAGVSRVIGMTSFVDVATSPVEAEMVMRSGEGRVETYVLPETGLYFFSYVVGRTGSVVGFEIYFDKVTGKCHICADDDLEYLRFARALFPAEAKMFAVEGVDLSWGCGIFFDEIVELDEILNGISEDAAFVKRGAMELLSH